jgi:hypothetical protein
VVTQYGCCRGGFFEGFELRRGKCLRCPTSDFGRTWLRLAGNAANPRSEAGCNKPAADERSKPSRWCKTTRAERDLRGWHLGAEARWQHRVGVNARQYFDGGDVRLLAHGEPARRGHCPRAKWSSEEERRLRGAYSLLSPRSWKPSKTRLGTDKVTEGAGKANDPLLDFVGVYGAAGNGSSLPGDPESRVNLTRGPTTWTHFVSPDSGWTSHRVFSAAWPPYFGTGASFFLAEHQGSILGPERGSIGSA